MAIQLLLTLLHSPRCRKPGLKTFLMLAISNLASVVYAYFCIPETNGSSLEDVESRTFAWPVQ